MKLLIVVYSIFILMSQNAFAQGTVYATSGSGRDGVSAARLQAQLAVEKDRNDKAAACGNAGQLYGPNHAAADANGCLPSPTIGASGFMGIGTPLPDRPLHIVSDMSQPLKIRGATPTLFLSSSSVVDQQWQIRNSNGVFRIQTQDDAGVSSANRVSITQQGDVGIGTNTPEARLDVAGAIRVGTTSTCDTVNAGSIRYNSGDKALEICDGDSWAAIGSGGGSGEKIGAIVPDLPDAILCTHGGTEKLIFDLDVVGSTLSAEYYRYQYEDTQGNAGFSLSFYSKTGTPTITGGLSAGPDCNGKTLAEIDSIGQAFWFGGGGSGGGGGVIVASTTAALGDSCTNAGQIARTDDDTMALMCLDDGGSLKYTSLMGGGSGGGGCTGLVNGDHTCSECTTASGTPHETPDGWVCRIAASSCPSGWTKYQNWTTTTPNTCNGSSWTGMDQFAPGYSCPGGSCTTGQHAFSDNSRETCVPSNGACSQIRAWDGNCISCTSTGGSSSCNAHITEIGCI